MQSDGASIAVTTRDPDARAEIVSRLILDHVTESERTFTCVARSGSQMAYATTTVIPSGKPASKELLSDAPSKARIVTHYTKLFNTIGQNVVLPCQATGRPKPEYSWTDPENRIIGANNPRFKVLPKGDLAILQLQFNDLGTYTCTARNDLSTDTAETFLYPAVSVSQYLLVAVYLFIFKFFFDFTLP